MDNCEKLIKVKKELLETINSTIVMELEKVEGLRKIFCWVEQDLLSLEDAESAVRQIVTNSD